MRARAGAVLLLLAVAVAPALAQRSETHRGLTTAFGFGRGSMRLNCDGCERGREADFSAMGRIGWTFGENLFVALEGTGFQHAKLIAGEPDESEYLWGGVVALWYPARYKDGFFKVGAGVSTSQGKFTLAGTGPVRLELTSPTILAGMGADLRMGRTFSITPFVDVMFALAGDTGGANATKLTSNVVNIGVALTGH